MMPRLSPPTAMGLPRRRASAACSTEAKKRIGVEMGDGPDLHWRAFWQGCLDKGCPNGITIWPDGSGRGKRPE